MLIQSLSEYTDTYLQDQLQDPAFEEKPVPFLLSIGENGQFNGIITREEEVVIQKGKKTKTYMKVLPLLVPKSPVSRAAGIYPLLAYDAVHYLLGFCSEIWSNPDEIEKHTDQHNEFIKLINHAYQQTNDPALLACVRFYQDETQLALAREAMQQQKVVKGSLVAFHVVWNIDSEETKNIVIDRKAVRDYWREHYFQAFDKRQESGGQGVCLITGKHGPIARTHDKIGGVSSLGGNAMGVSLISFDKDAFQSYGWEQNKNAPISPDRATAYVLALNDLLRSGNHRQGRSKNTVVTTRTDICELGFLYWTKEPEDIDFINTIASTDTKEIDKMLKLLNAEQKTYTINNNLYIVAVSGNGGRLVIRDFKHDLLDNVVKNINHWYSSINVVNVFEENGLSENPPIWKMLYSLIPQGAKLGNKEKAYALQIFRRAVFGIPLGYSILSTALSRLRVEKGVNRLGTVRIGLIRAALNDIISKKGETLMSDVLDVENNDGAYLCGRLMALYENIQYCAQGKLNMTVTDRYYGAAMENPQYVFPKLEVLCKQHLRKILRDKAGLANYFEKQIEELIGKMSQFPKHMNLENQGKFAIGYHHQKAEMRKKSEKPVNNSN